MLREPQKADAAKYRVAVNGQATLIDASPDTSLSAILTDAILLTGNERWGGEDRWECRTPRGELLDGSTKLGDLTPNERGTHVFIQLKPGVFA